MSEAFASVGKTLRVKRIKFSTYHPQSNGALERNHPVLVEYLRCFILEDQSDWDKWLPYATFVYNINPHTATEYTPMNFCSVGDPIYQLCYKENPRNPVNL
jgi:hypothetical protein